jgi:hypothetical protein
MEGREILSLPRLKHQQSKIKVQWPPPYASSHTGIVNKGAVMVIVGQEE